jgi:hypothetical protein
MHYSAAAVIGADERDSMKLGWQPRKWLDKKSKLGFRGYPVGAIAFYGPDDQRASKVAVAVIVAPDTEPVALRRWFAAGYEILEEKVRPQFLSLRHFRYLALRRRAAMTRR